MTLLVSWVGVDTHGTASAYLAADSRITWGHVASWDHGRKLFAFRSYPDILGCCGDLLFPTIVLAQITEMADAGLLFRGNATPREKHDAIVDRLQAQFQTYPAAVATIFADVLQVVHVSRETAGNRDFGCWLLEWRRKRGWSSSEVAIPRESKVLVALGTGAKEFTENLQRYQAAPTRGTSRGVFHCFCDTLRHVEDEHCGGPPQLVGMHRKPGSGAFPYGIILGQERYFLGAPVGEHVNFENVGWRNELFELCDGESRERLQHAQPQPDMLGRS